MEQRGQGPGAARMTSTERTTMRGKRCVPNRKRDAALALVFLAQGTGVASTSVPSSAPTSVPTSTPTTGLPYDYNYLRSLALGERHGCGVSTDGSVKCWVRLGRLRGERCAHARARVLPRTLTPFSSSHLARPPTAACRLRHQ